MHLNKGCWIHRVAALAGMVLWSACHSGEDASRRFHVAEPVGTAGTNRMVIPVNQILTPAGIQVDLPGMRPQAVALSPDGRWLVTAGKTHELVLLDPGTGRIVQRVPLPSDKATSAAPEVVSDRILDPDKEGQLSFTGLVFSPDGARLYVSNGRAGTVSVIDVASRKVVGTAEHVGARCWGIALTPDGRKLYVANGPSNDVAVLDAASLSVVKRIPVGSLPWGVAIGR